MSSTGVKIIFGAGMFGRRSLISGYPDMDDDTGKQFLRVLEKANVKEIDTARSYADSEACLGRIGAAERFTISTKAPAFFLGALCRSSVLAGARRSLENLQTKQVDVYFLHAPERVVPIEETIDAIQELYVAGAFKKFGLSNFTAEQVVQYCNCAESKHCVLPTVFQGCYSPVARRLESELLPTLRKLGMSIYAYSPLAGGFLAKTAEEIEGGRGRWDKKGVIGRMLHTVYNKPSYVAVLKEWDAIARDAGCSKAALAYRWVRYNSLLKPEHGDALIFAASEIEQLEETLKDLEDGPLDEETAKRVEELWDMVKADAPLDHYHG